MTFVDAWLAWIAGPLLVLWAAWWARERWGAGLSRWPSARFSSVSTLDGVPSSWATRARPLVEALRLLVVALIAVALARPVVGRGERHMTTDGVHIVLAIDTSGSMQAVDLDAGKALEKRRTRLGVVRDVVAEFIEARQSDAMGLVVFGAFAFTQVPLTLDRELLASFVRKLEIGMAGDNTAIGDGLATAVKRLKDDEARSKVIVLLTDGRSHTGKITPEKAAEIAATYGIKVHTIGAATEGRAPVIVQGLGGRRQLVYQDDDLDEATLEAIAEKTGGLYFRAEDAAGLSRIYAEIDALEKSAIETSVSMDYDERFAVFVGPALGLLLLELLLLGTRFRRAP